MEIRSVNHRYLALSTTLRGMPRAFEGSIQALLRRQLLRGRIDITVQALRSDAPRPTHRLDHEFCRQLLQEGRELAVELRLGAEMRLGELLRVPGAVVPEEPLANGAVASGGSPPPLDLVHETVQLALGVLVENRRHEGARLLVALSDQLDELRLLVEQLDSRREAVRDAAFERYRQRLTTWLESAQTQGDVDELDQTRIVQEAAIAAEKADVEEEIVRLRSHLDHFAQLLGGTDSSEGEPSSGGRQASRGGRSGAGKRLDFLLQEMARELATLAVKGKDADLSHLVVEAKTSCERLREQVQNIE